MERFISITGASSVTVGEVRSAGSRVGADLGVIIGEGNSIRAFRLPDLAEAGDADLISQHAELLTEMEEVSPGDEFEDASVAEERDFTVVVREDYALIVPTPGALGWSEVAGSSLEAFAPLARLPGVPPEAPDPQVQCSCSHGDTVTGPASDPPKKCAYGHPVVCP